MKPLSSTRRIERVRYELKLRQLTVAASERLGKHMQRITLTGDALADFESGSFDDHVKLFLDTPDGEVRRDYTPRSFDRERRQLVIEFALHDHGPATEWAQQAAAGQAATIGGPRGSMIIPMDYDWHLLLGDLSALPAMRRRLEELPAGSRALVLALAEDEADRLPFATRCEATVQWLGSEAELLAAVAALALPEGEGFAWGAGESAAMIAARRLLLGKGMAKENLRLAAYWKKGAADFHERLE